MERRRSAICGYPLYGLLMLSIVPVGELLAGEPYLGRSVPAYMGTVPGLHARSIPGHHHDGRSLDRESLPRQSPPERSPLQDEVLQSETAPLKAPKGAATSGIMTLPLVNIEGLRATADPPDPVGDVGRSHYVQMINATLYQVFDKSGHALTSPQHFGALWSDLPDTPGNKACSQDQGDPIVVYDHLADRWLMSQFAQTGDWVKREFKPPFYACMALSRTPDPVAGDWYLYAFELPDFPDYLKLGVWPDGYYMSSVEGNTLVATVFERERMLTGETATFARFDLPALGAPGVRDTRILPADLDGPPPPANTPNYFVRPVDGRQSPADPVDRIEIYAFRADFARKRFSFDQEATLTAAQGLAAFDIMDCSRKRTLSPNPRDCIPQPGLAGTLDALSNRPMMPLKFRSLADGRQVLLFNQTVNVQDGVLMTNGRTPPHEVAGIRWYQLERLTGGHWQIGQQGTYAPQSTEIAREAQFIHRWMGSLAMDGDGNLALAYQLVNGDGRVGQKLYPSMAYSGRRSGDTPNQLTAGEFWIARGTRPQWPRPGESGRGQRWGDYSSLSVDPVDDCTFWYTQHLASGRQAFKPTRIASFRFTDCGSNQKG